MSHSHSPQWADGAGAGFSSGLTSLVRSAWPCPGRWHLPPSQTWGHPLHLNSLQAQEQPRPPQPAGIPSQQHSEYEASGEDLPRPPCTCAEGRRHAAARALQVRWKVYRRQVRRWAAPAVPRRFQAAETSLRLAVPRRAMGAAARGRMRRDGMERHPTWRHTGARGRRVGGVHSRCPGGGRAPC